MKKRPIFKCHGGKFYLVDFLLDHFPSNYTELTYIEGCCGACSITLNKLKSIKEIVNDFDPTIVSIIRELSKNPDDFIETIKKIEYTKDTFLTSIEITDNPTNYDEKTIVVYELVRRRMSRGGLRNAFSWSDRLRGGRPGDLNAWETYKEQLPLIADRLKDVEVYCMPVISLIELFGNKDTFFYIDPPYLPRTRQAQKTYTIEMTEEQHIELAECLNKTESKVALSGYQSQLYAKLYKNWNMHCLSIANHSGQTKIKQKRIEVLWTNY